MLVRSRHAVVSCAAAAVALVLAPAAAQAQSPTGGAEAAPEPEVASASAGPVSVSTRAGALLGRTARFRGAIPAGDAGTTVTVERLDELTGTWSPVAHAVASQDGKYVAKWKADRVGRQQLRTRVEAPEASAAGAAPSLAITVYRTATATWYGPGFYGRKTACGTRLRRTTLGVAHKTLKCGTPVTVFYDGRTVTVPVTDRGPFSKNTSWAPTAATAETVGMEGTSTIGTLRA